MGVMETGRGEGGGEKSIVIQQGYSFEEWLMQE